jgi:hypothetical protein
VTLLGLEGGHHGRIQDRIFLRGFFYLFGFRAAHHVVRDFFGVLWEVSTGEKTPKKTPKRNSEKKWDVKK